MNNSIALKDILFEDFLNYRLPSMFLVTAECDWKCCNELDIDNSICQNQALVSKDTFIFSISDIIKKYLENDISKAVVFGGLEPLLQFNEVLHFIQQFREKSDDDIVIYTGYNKDEILDIVKELKPYKNIIIKYGRYIPDNKPHYDETLGINLVSDNQYAERISDVEDSNDF